jgi:hypothetical protein
MVSQEETCLGINPHRLLIIWDDQREDEGKADKEERETDVHNLCP